jgi:hypothetical protein
MVMIYWTTLADLGQLNSTNYPRNASHNVFLSMPMLNYYINLYNQTYPGYIASTGSEIVPYNTNTFVIPPALMVQDYSCNQLVRKAPLSIIVVLLGGLYPLFHGGYKGLQAILHFWFKGRGSKSICPFLLPAANVNVENHREGFVPKVQTDHSVTPEEVEPEVLEKV